MCLLRGKEKGRKPRPLNRSCKTTKKEKVSIHHLLTKKKKKRTERGGGCGGAVRKKKNTRPRMMIKRGKNPWKKSGKGGREREQPKNPASIAGSKTKEKKGEERGTGDYRETSRTKKEKGNS